MPKHNIHSVTILVIDRHASGIISTSTLHCIQLLEHINHCNSISTSTIALLTDFCAHAV